MAQQSIKDMIDIAIENARFHGIHLHHSIPNRANGDCAIEAVADNVSTRLCFPEEFTEDPDFYRKKWLSEAEDLVLKYSGMEETKFREEWNILKNPRTYEYEAGDFVLPAIAHCIQKDILVFNTMPGGTFDPIFVVKASSLANREANSKTPVLLAYNNSHFEGLVPDSRQDEAKTEKLRDIYVSNKYTLKKKDIPIFNTPQKLSYADKVKVLSVGEKDIQKKKIKDMTIEEKREYNRKKQSERRKSLTEKQKVDIKQVDRLMKAEYRESERKMDEIGYKKKQAVEKSIQRSKAMEADDIGFRKKQSTEKSNQRAQAMEVDDIGFRKKQATEKSNQRAQAMKVDEIGFRKRRATEKSKERLIAKKVDEVGFKKMQAAVKSIQRSKAMEVNDIGFRKKQAAEKSKQRAQAMEVDEFSFKKRQAADKSKQRNEARSMDEITFKRNEALKKKQQRLKERTENEAVFKNKRAIEKAIERLNKVKDEEQRRKRFIESIKRGRIFECVCCHRKMFDTGVSKLSQGFKEEYESDFCQTFKDSIGNVETRQVDGHFYWCTTCKTYITKGKIPPMSNQNNLQLFDLDGFDELKLTDLENSLIALNISLYCF